MTFSNNSSLGSNILGIFIDMNNTLYALCSQFSRIQIWFEGNLVPTFDWTSSSGTPQLIFVTVNGEISLDNGQLNSRVDRWRVNSTGAVSAMIVPDSCRGLFIDLRENLYCSLGSLHFVLRRSLMDPGNRTTIVAGNGTAGSALNQFNVPIGLVVDFHRTSFVADCNNNRVLRSFANELNGTIVVGSGAVETIDLNSPSGLALDAQGYLFISELWTN